MTLNWPGLLLSFIWSSISITYQNSETAWWPLIYIREIRLVTYRHLFVSFNSNNSTWVQSWAWLTWLSIAAMCMGRPALTAVWPGIHTVPGMANPAPDTLPHRRGEHYDSIFDTWTQCVYWCVDLYGHTWIAFFRTCWSYTLCFGLLIWPL